MRLTGTVTAIHPDEHFCIITRDDCAGDVRVPLVSWEAYRCPGPYEIGWRFDFLVMDDEKTGPVGVNLRLVEGLLTGLTEPGTQPCS